MDWAVFPAPVAASALGCAPLAACLAAVSWCSCCRAAAPPPFGLGCAPCAWCSVCSGLCPLGCLPGCRGVVSVLSCGGAPPFRILCATLWNKSRRLEARGPLDWAVLCACCGDSALGRAPWAACLVAVLRCLCRRAAAPRPLGFLVRPFKTKAEGWKRGAVWTGLCSLRLLLCSCAGRRLLGLLACGRVAVSVSSGGGAPPFRIFGATL